MRWSSPFLRKDVKISKERAATSLLGTSASPQQISNANLANFLYQVWTRLVNLNDQHIPAVYSTLRPSIQVCPQ